MKPQSSNSSLVLRETATTLNGEVKPSWPNNENFYKDFSSPLFSLPRHVCFCNGKEFNAFG